MNSRDIIAKLEANGWTYHSTTGSHRHYKHPSKPGKVTVPYPRHDIPIGTIKSIEKQSGVKLR
ncbi:MAG TPA: type II toxin-antitoxin system HicA family toxin [Rhizomicrobium sp.]|jgi:predicted RNA binding protein YcfA (HicA-like mRNA interferase family)|nr:type II toxin-antitoxin system HicA family toxin [Rhizomicrobium sp.]